MKKNIAVIRGDGIGPEIVREAIKVLDEVALKFGHAFFYTEVLAGGCSVDACGVPLTEAAIAVCKGSDSVLLGAVGGPKWDMLDKSLRPEQALFGLRRELGLFSNMRPVKLFSKLAHASPLKTEIIEQGIDLLIVRELTGGIYFGAHRTVTENGRRFASDDMAYGENEIERIGRAAFEAAGKRRKILCSVDKANVLDCSRLWRDVMHRLSYQYPEISYSDMLVDNCAMQLLKNPAQFDVIVTENMFGDILSDEASMLTGSIGMMPSSSLGVSSCGMYEPIHGSAPDIAGKNLANPVGTILSAAMMLQFSFDMTAESKAVEKAVEAVLEEGYRTGDIMSKGATLLSCSEMGDRIAKKLSA